MSELRGKHKVLRCCYACGTWIPRGPEAELTAGPCLCEPCLGALTEEVRRQLKNLYRRKLEWVRWRKPRHLPDPGGPTGGYYGPSAFAVQLGAAVKEEREACADAAWKVRHCDLCGERVGESIRARAKA